MKVELTAVGIALALTCGVASQTYAATITLATPGVVGAADGLAGDNPGSDAILIAQDILDLVGLGVVTTFDGRTWRTSTTVDYSGTLSDPKKIDGGKLVVPTGYEYAIAKYDGKEAGWVLFYLPTFGYTLPQYAYELWGKPDQYALSGFTAFNPTSVPDGGSTAALLGSVLLGFGMLRKRFARQ